MYLPKIFCFDDSVSNILLKQPGVIQALGDR